MKPLNSFDYNDMDMNIFNCCYQLGYINNDELKFIEDNIMSVLELVILRYHFKIEKELNETNK